MRQVDRCTTAVCHDTIWPTCAFAIRILVAMLAHYFLVPSYRLVKEMQETERKARFSVASC